MLVSCWMALGTLAVPLLLGMHDHPRGAEPMDMTRSTLVVPESAARLVRTAAEVLREEVEKRTGIRWPIATAWPKSGWAIGIVAGGDSLSGRPRPEACRPPEAADGFALLTDLSNQNSPVLWIVGHDGRGALYGVGRLLRALECRRGAVRLHAPLNLSTSPAYPIRGHQLGYRATANSYDAWSPEQFDQYIRELTFFGVNAVEGIPFQDNRPTVGNVPRDRMNVEQSRICQKYGLDYWVWTPADFDLKDEAKRREYLGRYEKLFRECPVISAIFVPGGDPGDNHPEQVMPYLEEIAGLLARYHPNAKVWLSPQGYDPFEQDYVYRWIQQHRPKWLGGLVAGPSSPPLHEMRARLPRSYRLRDYPDITHCVRCQFPVPWWDPAFAFTLGREPVNPRPTFYARILHDTAVFTDGFITYSDGVHDDVNKVVWSALGWDPQADVRTLMEEYARVFLGADVAEQAASGILALERNWEGPLATNGSVDATLAFWQTLEREHPDLRANWRFQMFLLRAYYDAYVRHRLLYEQSLEREAHAVLLQAAERGSGQCIEQALAILRRAEAEPVRTDLSTRVTELCDELFMSIGLQTSVAKYGASGPERGAVLDFLNYPLNNRWWLEDELAKVRALPSEEARVARLRELARWEQPGDGSFYDDIGNIARSPHEVRNERLAAPILDMDHMALPGVMWWVGDHPNARARQSWFTGMDWPQALRYAGLDPDADYVVRVTGYGDCFLRANGLRLVPTLYGKGLGEIKEFPVPRGLYRDGMLTLTFDATFEPHLNWRVQSRLCEVWLIKRQSENTQR